MGEYFKSETHNPLFGSNSYLFALEYETRTRTNSKIDPEKLYQYSAIRYFTLMRNLKEFQEESDIKLSTSELEKMAFDALLEHLDEETGVIQK